MLILAKVSLEATPNTETINTKRDKWNTSKVRSVYTAKETIRIKKAA